MILPPSSIYFLSGLYSPFANHALIIDKLKECHKFTFLKSLSSLSNICRIQTVFVLVLKKIFEEWTQKKHKSGMNDLRFMK